MNTTPTNQARLVHAQPITEEELEAQAIKWCEKKGRALDRKKSGYTPKRRGQYENRC